MLARVLFAAKGLPHALSNRVFVARSKRSQEIDTG
jgi:hypothetical protein